MCSRCWTRSPTRPVTQAENLMAALDTAPPWLVRFAEFATERHCVARACLMVSAIGRLATDGESGHAQAMLERSRRPGRSAGALARTLEEFLVGEHLAFGLDQKARLAHGRRQRRINAIPASLRPAVAAFADHLVRSGERARRAGTRPRADNTIEQTLSIVRDLAHFVAGERAKHDWATVDVGDVELFLRDRPANRRRRLQAARQFFRWARKNKVLLVDPTRDLPGQPRSGFTGQTLSLAEQRRLFRRWNTDPAVHPHEALVGILALLHATSSLELRQLQVTDFRPAPPQPAYRTPTTDRTRPSQRRGHTAVPSPPQFSGNPEPAPHRDHPNQDPQHARLHRVHRPRARRSRGRTQAAPHNPHRRSGRQPRPQGGR